MIAALVTFPLNWFAGWSLVLLSFIAGAALGLRFHEPGFLGGYDSLARRMLRLGHIALAAIGMLNLLLSVSPVRPGLFPARVASVAMVVGGLTMPLVCFLTAWKPAARRLFVVPVLLLVAAVGCALVSGIIGGVS